MFRKSVGAALVLALLAGAARAQDENPKAGKRITGKIKKADAKKGTLTITVKGKGKSKDVDVKVTKQTRFMALPGGGAPKMLTGTAGLKAKEFKAGTLVTVILDDDDNARLITSAAGRGRGPRGGPGFGPPGAIVGKVKKIDAKKGVLTVTIKRKGKDKDVDLKIDDETRFTIFTGKGAPKSVTGKKGLKAEQLKVGASVRYFKGKGGKLMGIMVGAPKFGPPIGPYGPGFKPGQGLRGTIKKIDAKKGTLTLTVKEKDEEKEVTVKIEKDTRFMVFAGKKGPKNYTGTKGLKAEEFKVGTQVGVFKDQTGKVKAVMVGNPKIGPPDKKKPVDPKPEDKKKTKPDEDSAEDDEDK
jgi:hypothetical protein